MKIFVPYLAAVTLALGRPVEEVWRESDSLESQGKHHEALVLLVEADRRVSGEAETLRRMARQYDQLSRATGSKAERKDLTRQALDAALRAVKADPENARAHLALAIVYGRTASDESPRRKVELSRLIKEEAETAARLDPGQDEAWHILGRWNYELANFNPVLKALAQTIYGKFPDASNENAAAHLKKAVALRPRSILHQVELGRAYLALGEREKARAHLKLGLGLFATTSDEQEAQERARVALEQLP